MRVFTCTSHDYHWPVGVASVVVAESEEAARKLLDEELVSGGLRPFDESPYDLVDVDTNRPHAKILCDGNY